MPQRRHLLLVVPARAGRLRVLRRANDVEVLLQLDAGAHRQRAGRVRVGRAGGGSESPDCSGFTVAQLQSLDFAAMDFTEFYASLVPTSPNSPATLQTNSASRVPACYYGQGRCRR